VRRVDPKATETPGVRSCPFCTWRLRVTEVDRCGDTIAAFNLHIQRHSEAATVEAAERATFDSLVQSIS
jgi:hypothetical protein